MKSIFSSIFFIVLTLIGGPQIAPAQSTSTSGQAPSADEILAAIASHCKLSPVAGKVLIAGQVKTSVLIHRSKASLTWAIAAVGGVTAEGRSSIYLLRSAGGNRSVREIDLGQIRTGQIDDVSLHDGDVVFVPHINGEIPRSGSQQPSVCAKVPTQRPWYFVDSPVTPRRSNHDQLRVVVSQL
jgi:hypothetical protein